MKVTVLASCSRGDVQPAIALTAALTPRRHATRLVAPASFATLTAGRGVEFRPLPFDIVKETREPETTAIRSLCCVGCPA
jgi:UDP:flavonoid glycosyltransferase YjiC (YdhE family)